MLNSPPLVAAGGQRRPAKAKHIARKTFLYSCRGSSLPAGDAAALPGVDQSCRVVCRPATKNCFPAKPDGNFHPLGRYHLSLDGEICPLGNLSLRQDPKTCGWKPFSGGWKPKLPAGSHPHKQDTIVIHRKLKFIHYKC